MPSSFFFYCYAAHRYLHSFPTRRSSDLTSTDLPRNLTLDAALRWVDSPHINNGPAGGPVVGIVRRIHPAQRDRKSTRLNSSHTVISYAVFCLKKKKKEKNRS